MTDSNINGYPLPQPVSCADGTQNQAVISDAQGINCNNATALSSAPAVGAETSYQAVSQSMAQWIQSAALFSQDTLVTTAATMAVFEKKIADIVNTEEPTEAANAVAELTVAMSAFLQAVEEGTDRIAASIGRTANHILNGFPSDPSSNTTADPVTIPAAPTSPESPTISPTAEPAATDQTDSNSSAATEPSAGTQTPDSEA